MLGQPLVGVIAHEPCAHGQAVMPRTRTPTARRTPWALAVATPISVEISWLGSPLRGAVRVVDWIASMRTCERSAPWRPERLARDRARELLDVQRLADHEALDRLADLLGEARHVHALVRRVEVDRALELRRVEPLLAAVGDADDALDPVTPARVSETRTRGAEACTSCRSATSSLARPAHALDRTRVPGGSSTATATTSP